MTTRPTTDRVREALFSILGNITDEVVVDCYAGTGALGMEALSRGARRSYFLEIDGNAGKAIAANLAKLNFEERGQLLRVPVERSAQALQSAAPVDLVLSDPPWPICAAAAVTVARVLRPLLADNARVVLGHPVKEPVEVPREFGLELVQRRSWGDSALSFFRPLPSELPA